MERIQQMFYDYGLWIAVGLLALVVVLLIVLIVLNKSRVKTKKENKLLKENNTEYSRQITELQQENERLQSEKVQAETARDEAEEARKQAVVDRAEAIVARDKAKQTAAEAYEDEEYEVSEFDDVTKPAAYTVKYDRVKMNWVVTKEGQQRPVRRLATKDEALRVARDLAKKTGAGLYVHKKDGKFQKI